MKRIKFLLFFVLLLAAANWAVGATSALTIAVQSPAIKPDGNGGVCGQEAGQGAQVGDEPFAGCMIGGVVHRGVPSGLGDVDVAGVMAGTAGVTRAGVGVRRGPGRCS